MGGGDPPTVEMLEFTYENMDCHARRMHHVTIWAALLKGCPFILRGSDLATLRVRGLSFNYDITGGYLAILPMSVKRILNREGYFARCMERTQIYTL